MEGDDSHPMARSLERDDSLQSPGRGISSRGIPHPQRHKVPLPIPSFKAELWDAFESLRALFLIPLHPFKKFKGKPWRTQALMAASTILPPFEWLSSYKKEYLLGDILAGVTVWSLVPEDLGYAQLANLPAQLGLFASFLPPLAYVIFGTSRHLSVGPTPLISLLLGTLCSRYYDPQSEAVAYVSLAVATTFFAGIFGVAFGLLRLGFLADLLSHAVILGFLAGAAILTIFIELLNVLGYTSPVTGHNIVYFFKYLISNAAEFNWRAFLIGVTFFVFLRTLKFLARRSRKSERVGKALHFLSICGPILSVALATLCVFLTRADQPPANVPTVERVSGDFRELVSSAQSLGFNDLSKAAVTGLVVGLVSFAESIAISRTFASAGKYQIRPNQEMFAVGAMNVVASITSGLAVAGSFPRSALSFTAGARSQLFSVIMSVLVLITIVALTPVIDYIPEAVLGAVIIDAVLDLIRIPSILHVWRTDKGDFLVFLVTFLAILFLEIDWGFLVAVLAGLVKMLLPVSRPRLRALGQVPGTGLYRPVGQYSVAEEVEGVLVVGIYGPVVFANSKHIKEAVLDMVEDRGDRGPAVKVLVLDFTPVPDVDSTGIHSLFELVKDVGPIQVCISNPAESVLRKLVASRFIEALGVDNVFFSTSEAVHTMQYLEQQNGSLVGNQASVYRNLSMENSLSQRYEDD